MGIVFHRQMTIATYDKTFSEIQSPVHDIDTYIHVYEGEVTKIVVNRHNQSLVLSEWAFTTFFPEGADILVCAMEAEAKERQDADESLRD